MYSETLILYVGASKAITYYLHYIVQNYTFTYILIYHLYILYKMKIKNISELHMHFYKIPKPICQIIESCHLMRTLKSLYQY